jgi:2-polyprenyl-3-methyl-5-hydroxy-6-metoxy-1,4-benzoquinol methylase
VHFEKNSAAIDLRGKHMNTKELSLDIEALISQTLYGHGFLHYGYWPDTQTVIPSLESLGKAQQAYFDRMVAMIPQGIRTILDVGSGTGSNAKALLDRGYTVDCLCPSARLNLIAREKLKGNAEIFECHFEEFKSASKYDLIICCESFHYIHAAQGLR